MQHRVLSVDLSCEPARLVLAAVENRSVEVLEACEYHLGPNSGDLFSATPENSEHTDDSDAAASNGSFGQDNVEAESDTIILARELTGTEKLANMLEQINGTWSSAVVIVPSDDYMHLEVEMPFNDQKQLQKILHHEVQDQVPFDVSNFHLMPGTITADGLNSYRVHVGIADREKVANLIANCKESGFEPIVVSPSCSVPAAIYALAPDYFADSSAVVWAEGPHYTITVRIDGEIKSQRVLMPLSRYSQNGSQESGTIDPRTSVSYTHLTLPTSFLV